jgi:VanZ family protein
MRAVFFLRPQQSPERLALWRWFLTVWGPVFLAIAVICAESTSTFSAQNTSMWLRPWFQHWFGFIGDENWDLFHHYLRKSGHFIGYGTVGFTFLRAWLHTLDRRCHRSAASALLSWRIESSVLAVLSTAIVAAGDEFHQSFLPTRTGKPQDVLLDCTGAAVFCLLIWLICWRRPATEQEW